MSKTSASVLISDLAKRVERDSTDPLVMRPTILRQLNISQREICQEHSLRFLVSPAATLAVVASTCAVPSNVDDSKTMTLGRPSGDGEIIYVELDAWFMTSVDTYGQGSAQTEPTHYTIAGSQFLFKPAGLSATVPYLAQLRVVDMTDASNSFSVLPEGWEDTLLMDHAEAELRRINNQPQVEELKARATAMREALYGSYRTSKIAAKTDREQKERKIEKSQLSDEATP